MKIDVLISTMNQTNVTLLIKKMNVNNCTIINQITKEKLSLVNKSNKQYKIYSFKEKGLSKSRNKAIKYSDGNICVIADDDMYYENDYIQTIKTAYKKYPDADLIAFVVPYETKQGKQILKEGKVNFLQSQKIQSVQLTFKKESIIRNHITFDEEFGAGAKYYCGEENIFMCDCMKKGLKLYFVPQKIATLSDEENSSWFKGYDIKYFKTKGAVYNRMSSLLCFPLILQFAVRKKKLYENQFSLFEIIKIMLSGAREYRSGKKK